MRSTHVLLLPTLIVAAAPTVVAEDARDTEKPSEIDVGIDVAATGRYPVFVRMSAQLIRRAGDYEFDLATGGAGGDLPRYAGAVPPEGVEDWDWDITWRSRMMRAKYFEQNRQ